MLYTDKTKLAMNICCTAHFYQKDKAGFPYINHPFWVAEKVDSEEEICVALLHDVVEDSMEYNLNMLRKLFNNTIVDAIDAITRRENENYFDYINRCGKNSIARKVKLADLMHNTNPQRVKMSHIGTSMIERYIKAIHILSTHY